MPSPFAHTAAGYLIYRCYKRKLPDGRVKILTIPFQLIVLAVLSLLPDLDALPGIIMGDLGRFHNNASHSLVVGGIAALIFSAAASRVYKSPMKVWFVVALTAYELHLVMDFFTGDRGVMLLWPLTATRFSSPIKLFVGLQWGKGLFSIWHLWTLFTEALFFLLILMLVNLSRWYIAKTRLAHRTSDRASSH
ncbi:MAG TPA: metal-dependent hydrolase [Anaerolineales bacterium]|nr:metal-dependent hydrolase [Anaerolineales bacterium]